MMDHITEKTLKDRSFECGECWIWNQTLGHGKYPVMTVRGCGCQLVRRIAARLAGLNPKKREPVQSVCNEDLCVRPKHMRLSTPSAIGKRAAARGAFSSPERRAKISAGMKALRARQRQEAKQ